MPLRAALDGPSLKVAGVADVTYGRGVFWKRIPTGAYDLHVHCSPDRRLVGDRQRGGSK